MTIKNKQKKKNCLLQGRTVYALRLYCGLRVYKVSLVLLKDIMASKAKLVLAALNLATHSKRPNFRFASLLQAMMSMQPCRAAATVTFRGGESQSLWLVVF